MPYESLNKSSKTFIQRRFIDQIRRKLVRPLFVGPYTFRQKIAHFNPGPSTFHPKDRPQDRPQDFFKWVNRQHPTVYIFWLKIK